MKKVQVNRHHQKHISSLNNIRLRKHILIYGIHKSATCYANEFSFVHYSTLQPTEQLYLHEPLEE